MSKRLWVGGSLLVLFACTPQPVGQARSSGSIGISPDDLTLYVADADNHLLVVLDAKSEQVLAKVPVGQAPERVLVGPDGSVYVTNRGGRTVSVLPPGGREVIATIEVGAEPVGMSLSADGKRLLVANSMSASLSVVDLASQTTVGELPVAGQPWAVAALPDGKRAYVTDFTGGRLRVVDLETGEQTGEVPLQQPAGFECPQGAAPERTPAQIADVVISPDGDRAYVAHVQSRTSATRLGLALAVAPALSTMETRDDLLFKEGDGPRDFPAPVLASNLDESCRTLGRGPGMDAPSSLVVDSLGEWLFVADHNSNAVAVVSAHRASEDLMVAPERGIYDVVRVGARPTGIAVSSDLRTAYVHNALDHSVSVVRNEDHRLTSLREINFGRAELPAAVERGRRLFYSAVDPRVTEPELGGVSCSSCHPDGRADGLSWQLPDPSNTVPLMDPTRASRNTPALWNVSATAPYQWDGRLKDLPSFSHLMVAQMNGDGLSNAEVEDLGAYLATLSPPENPNLKAALATELAEGEQLFAARCSQCHSGALLTDLSSHPDLQSPTTELDTPSLRGLFATAPYLHDGSAATVRDVLFGDLVTVSEHNLRGKLSSSQLRSLETFLKTR